MATSEDKERVPAEGTTTQTTTGGTKPLHRFLRAEPKSVGIVLMFLGSCLFMFGIPLKTDTEETYGSFWLGILYFACGIVYMLAERQPTKKIVTACLALSIISILGTAVAAIDFIKAMATLTDRYHYHITLNIDELKNTTSLGHYYMSMYNLEAVFLFNSTLGAVILITMSVFARLALRPSRTQAVVVMRTLPTAE